MLSGREENQPLLRAEGIEKRYGRANGFGSNTEVAALRGVSLSIFSQTTMALVGESGSGKSTLALCLGCMERPTSGKIWMGDQEITALNDQELRAMRPHIQLVFQDPANSLNPRWTVGEIVSEPLLIQRRLGKQGRREKVAALLERVGLSSEKADRRPGELSGGQRQRVAIARALALEPKLLLLDEALSALDCSVQAQIVNLLMDLQVSIGLTYLFITHDFAMAAHVADQIAVMDQGKIVESGTAENVMRAPQSAVTIRMIAAARGTLVSPHEPEAR
jgi:ABC-type glutathione transport system ATPase component